MRQRLGGKLRRPLGCAPPSYLCRDPEMSAVPPRFAGIPGLPPRSNWAGTQAVRVAGGRSTLGNMTQTWIRARAESWNYRPAGSSAAGGCSCRFPQGLGPSSASTCWDGARPRWRGIPGGSAGGISACRPTTPTPWTRSRKPGAGPRPSGLKWRAGAAAAGPAPPWPAWRSWTESARGGGRLRTGAYRPGRRRRRGSGNTWRGSRGRENMMATASGSGGLGHTIGSFCSPWIGLPWTNGAAQPGWPDHGGISDDDARSRLQRDQLLLQ